MSVSKVASKSRNAARQQTSQCAPVEYNDYTELHASARNDLIEFGSVMLPPWIQHDGQPITSIDISPDGSRVITSGLNKRVFVWNASVLNSVYCEERADIAVCAAELKLPSAANTVRFSPDGMYIAAAQDDGCIAIFRQDYAHDPSAPADLGEEQLLEKWVLATTVKAHNFPAIDLAWSPDGLRLACTSVDNTVSVWDVAPLPARARSSPLFSHARGDTTGLLNSHTNIPTHAASTGVEGKAPSRVALLRGHNTWVTGVCWDPLYQYLATQDDAGVVIVWSATRFEMVRKLSVYLNKPAGAERLAPLGQTTGAAGDFQFNFSRISFSADGGSLCACKGFNFTSSVATAAPSKARGRDKDKEAAQPPRGQCVSVMFQRSTWAVETQIIGHAQPTTVSAYGPRLFRGDVRALASLPSPSAFTENSRVGSTTTTSTSTSTSASTNAVAGTGSADSPSSIEGGNVARDAPTDVSVGGGSEGGIPLSVVENHAGIKYLCPPASMAFTEPYPSARHTRRFKEAATTGAFRARAEVCERFTLAAFGSADGCISVWSTACRTPLLVLDHVFDAAVMDLRWSTDGYSLFACSHGGEALQLRFGVYDLGVPLSDLEVHSLLLTQSQSQAKVLAHSIYSPSNPIAQLRPYFYVHSFLSTFALDGVNRGYEAIDDDTDFNALYRNLLERRKRKNNAETEDEASFLEFDLREICPENKAFLLEYLHAISHMTSIPLALFLEERRLNRVQRLLIDTTVYPTLAHTVLLTNDPDMTRTADPAFAQTHGHCLLLAENAAAAVEAPLAAEQPAFPTHTPAAAVPTIHVLKPVSKKQRLLGAQPGGSVTVSVGVASSSAAPTLTTTTAVPVTTLQARSRTEPRRVPLTSASDAAGTSTATGASRLQSVMGVENGATTTGFAISSPESVAVAGMDVAEVTATVTRDVIAQLAEALSAPSASTDPAMTSLVAALNNPARVAMATAVDAQVHRAMAGAALPLLAAVSRQCLGAPILSHYGDPTHAPTGLGALTAPPSASAGMGVDMGAVGPYGPVSGLMLSASTAASMPWYQLVPMLPIARISLVARRALPHDTASVSAWRGIVPPDHVLTAVDAHVALESTVNAVVFDMLMGEPTAGELSGKNVLHLLSLLQRHNKVYATISMEELLSSTPETSGTRGVLATVAGEKPFVGDSGSGNSVSDDGSATPRVLKGFGDEASPADEEEVRDTAAMRVDAVLRWRTMLPGLPVACVHNSSHIAVCAMEPNLAALSQSALFSAATPSATGTNALFDLVNLVQSSVYTLHLFNIAGTALAPPIALPAPLHSMCITDLPPTASADGLTSKLMLLLADASVMVMDLAALRVDITSNISHLLTATVTPPAHTVTTTVIAGSTQPSGKQVRADNRAKESKGKKKVDVEGGLGNYTASTSTSTLSSSSVSNVAPVVGMGGLSSVAAMSSSFTASSAATATTTATSTSFPTLALEVFQRQVRAAQRAMLAAAYLTPNGVPVVSLSSRQTYMFHASLRMWVRATDTAVPHGTLREYSHSLMRHGGLVDAEEAVLGSLQRNLLNRSVIDACKEVGGRAEGKYTFGPVQAAANGEGATMTSACSEWNHWEQQLCRSAMVASAREYTELAKHYVASLCRSLQDSREPTTADSALVSRLAYDKLDAFLLMLANKGLAGISELAPSSTYDFPFSECIQRSVCPIMAMHVDASSLAQHYSEVARRMTASGHQNTGSIDESWGFMM